MRLFSPIILILCSAMNHIRHQLPVSDSIAAQFVRHDLSGLATMTPQQPPEEALSGSTLPVGLQEHIDHLAILIDGSPKTMLLAIDLNGPAHRRRLRQ